MELIDFFPFLVAFHSLNKKFFMIIVYRFYYVYDNILPLVAFFPPTHSPHFTFSNFYFLYVTKMSKLTSVKINSVRRHRNQKRKSRKKHIFVAGCCWAFLSQHIQELSENENFLSKKHYVEFYVVVQCVDISIVKNLNHILSVTKTEHRSWKLFGTPSSWFWKEVKWRFGLCKRELIEIS